VDRPLVDRLSCQGHSPGSHVGSGEALKAYKRETPLKMTSSLELRKSTGYIDRTCTGSNAFSEAALIAPTAFS
jgi:hypothetical protein